MRGEKEGEKGSHKTDPRPKTEPRAATTPRASRHLPSFTSTRRLPTPSTQTASSISCATTVRKGKAKLLISVPSSCMPLSFSDTLSSPQKVISDGKGTSICQNHDANIGFSPGSCNGKSPWHFASVGPGYYKDSGKPNDDKTAATYAQGKVVSRHRGLVEDESSQLSQGDLKLTHHILSAPPTHQYCSGYYPTDANTVDQRNKVNGLGLHNSKLGTPGAAIDQDYAVSRGMREDPIPRRKSRTLSIVRSQITSRARARRRVLSNLRKTPHSASTTSVSLERTRRATLWESAITTPFRPKTLALTLSSRSRKSTRTNASVATAAKNRILR